MKTFKTEAIVDSNHEIHVKLPGEVRAESVEVLILFDEHAGTSKVDKSKPARKFGQFRGKIKMDEDFDEALPNEFWLGHES